MQSWDFPGPTTIGSIASPVARVAADQPLTNPNAGKVLSSPNLFIAMHSTLSRDGCRSAQCGSRTVVTKWRAQRCAS
uniref:Uncharacterized protein n=1 Tax=Ralstonia solanacearum TaxID=305 RepID=A0A0S4U441_RALSL|nr:protein of unknown function [Ralstonia solanacearum]